MTSLTPSPFAVNDKRHIISNLLKEYQPEIESVKRELTSHECYRKNRADAASCFVQYDDMWILKFLLSHKKNVKAASKAAVKTMIFREKNKLNELGDIRYKSPTGKSPPPENEHEFPIFTRFGSFWTSEMALIHQQPDQHDFGIVSYFMIGKCEIDRLVEEISSEELNHYFVMYNECMSQILDGITRREDRLTKLVKVYDEEDIKVSLKILKSVEKYAKASQIAEDFYPQLVGAMILVNCNPWVTRLWKLIKPFLPKRLLEKISVIGKPTLSNMTLLRDYVSEENIPMKYGGLNTQWPTYVVGVAKVYEKK